MHCLMLKGGRPVARLSVEPKAVDRCFRCERPLDHPGPCIDDDGHLWVANETGTVTQRDIGALSRDVLGWRSGGAVR